MSKSSQEYEAEIAQLSEAVQQYEAEIARLTERIAELEKPKQLLFSKIPPFPPLSDREWVIQQFQRLGRECPDGILRMLEPEEQTD